MPWIDLEGAVNARDLSGLPDGDAPDSRRQASARGL